MAVPAKYTNYNNVFLAENVIELLENIGKNKHAIKLKESKQPFFGSIYSLSPVELETLKFYIKINLANGFIWPFKSPVGISIPFNEKPDRSFRFCVDYWGLNNITIKNQYPQSLIGESLNQFDSAKQFTSLNLINAYH